jgi:hypothetical protein
MTSDAVHTVKPKVCESVIMQLESLKATIKGIIVTGLLADIWVRSPITVSLEQISDTDLAKDKLLDLCNHHKLCFDFKSTKLDQFWYRIGVP